MMNFIRTSDEETAKKLRESGFTEIKEQSVNNIFCFLNDSKLKFEDKGKITYTNTLSA